MKNYEIAPSVLSANFLNLNQELEKCQQAKINWLHYDVMDYDFVPNLTFGAKILQDIVQAYSFKIDIHFMIKVKSKQFEDFFTEYLKLKPTMMTMHIEAMTEEETNKFIDLCRENDVLASLALKPDTSIEAINNYLPKIDNVLVMTVEPGFGGQEFIEKAALKISELKKIKEDQNYKYTVEVDGGINDQTVEKVKSQGVDLIVAGSYLFGHEDFQSRVQVLKNE